METNNARFKVLEALSTAPGYVNNNNKMKKGEREEEEEEDLNVTLYNALVYLFHWLHLQTSLCSKWLYLFVYLAVL